MRARARTRYAIDRLPALPGRRRRLSAAERALLDGIERAIRGIAQPVDNSAVFHLQCQYQLDAAGFYVVREAPMSARRRVDLVVVSRGRTVAIELDHYNPVRRSYEKFRDLPPEVLRMVVLRKRLSPIRINWADRTVCMRATLTMIGTLCGGTSTDMRSVDAQQRQRGVVLPLREDLLVPARMVGRTSRRR